MVGAGVLRLVGVVALASPVVLWLAWAVGTMAGRA